MKDRPATALLKLLARLCWSAELGVRRALGRLREKPRWKLEGSCNGCGRCCEEPTLAVPALFWKLPLTKALVLWWQRRVNGFELLGEDREGNALSFRCSHCDPRSGSCDSYRSRPGICRDYPRVLLDQAWPELFPGCGFHLRALGAEGLRLGIEQSGLPEEKKAELRRKLRL